jgi:sphinganine-1-phosphate aldolase
MGQLIQFMGYFVCSLYGSVHICVTLQHVDVVDDFLGDLAAAVVTVQENPGKFEDGMAPIYGAAAKMPDRGTVRDILVAYMDSTC